MLCESIRIIDKKIYTKKGILKAFSEEQEKGTLSTYTFLSAEEEENISLSINLLIKVRKKIQSALNSIS